MLTETWRLPEKALAGFILDLDKHYSPPKREQRNPAGYFVLSCLLEN